MKIKGSQPGWSRGNWQSQQDPESECSRARHALINSHSSRMKWVIVHFQKGLYDMAEGCTAQEVYSKLCAAQNGTAVTVQWLCLAHPGAWETVHTSLKCSTGTNPASKTALHLFFFFSFWTHFYADEKTKRFERVTRESKFLFSSKQSV